MSAVPVFQRQSPVPFKDRGSGAPLAPVRKRIRTSDANRQHFLKIALRVPIQKYCLADPGVGAEHPARAERQLVSDPVSSRQTIHRVGLGTYVGGLSLLATLTFGACVLWIGSRPVGDRWPELVLFVVAVIVSEVRPILFARSSGVQEIVASATFTFALFLEFGPVLAFLSQAVASLAGDLFARKTPIKLIFNFAQYWVAWGMATLVYVAIEGRQNFGTAVGGNWHWSAAVVAAAAACFLTNNTLVGIAIALATNSRVAKVVRASVTQEAISDGLLLALSPIVLIVAERSLVFLPLLLLPVYAVYRSASIASEKEHQALHDSLTDLPNRLSFEAILQRRMAQPKMGAHKAAVMLIDLDHFKEVNDTLGHHAGDELLCQIGPRIVDIVPEDATIARFGGDEFALLLPRVLDEADAQRTALDIAKALEQPFRIDGFNLEVQGSIGVALFPDHGSASDELIKRADIAMYVAKRLQTSAEIYDPEQDHHSTRRLELVSELRKAIVEGEIILYYQPKLDLSTGLVTSAEALVRWMHPRLGLVPPNEFVPVAEHTGLIRPLTSFVLATAIRQAAAWRNGGRELAIAVNLSARNLHDGGIIHDVPTNLAHHSLPARLLRLEITESSIMADPLRARRTLEQLHDMGVSLSIDDFGTGYSSLAYLQNLPVSEIKIDRSFVMNLVDNGADQAIVRSTIELAKNLGLTSTAEGVETEETMQWLRAAGCDQAQGYHIARPMTAEALTKWLDGRNPDPSPGPKATEARDLDPARLSLTAGPGGVGC